MKPYYEDSHVTIYHGDCREITLDMPVMTLVTDPPYPNYSGLFDEYVEGARRFLAACDCPEALVFWSELEQPEYCAPLVAVHVWHRTNVNGKIYEPVYHFAEDGRKRRSDVLGAAAVFGGVGPGCDEYVGHPTQKNEGVMRWLVRKAKGRIVLDPFMGSGTTLVAAKRLGRQAIGVEINERFCEMAARRCAQGSLFVAGDGDDTGDDVQGAGFFDVTP